MVTRPTFLEVVQLPGISDLPTQVKWHFAKALLAEMEGNVATAASEFELAIKFEDAFAKRVIDVSIVGDEGY